jgi:glycosyltransferase involved in cell wall biosynthesis
MSTAFDTRISILMMAYKASDTIVAAMDGALSQTIACEIIVSDDGSPDDTFSIMQAHAENYRGPHTLIVRRNEPNQGITQHLNTLMGLASGDIFIVMAGDDVSYPQRAIETSRAFAANPGAFVLGSSSDEVDMHDAFIRRRPRDLPATFSLMYFAKVGKLATILGATMAFRREIYDRFGPLRGSVEDNVITLRGALLGGGVFLDQALIRYRQNPDSLGNWLFARGDKSPQAFRKRYQRTSIMYLAIADDLEYSLSQVKDVKADDRQAAEQIIRIYRLEAEARTAILDKPRSQWISPIWRGLKQTGLRRKSFERAFKLLLPKRWFGMKA